MNIKVSELSKENYAPFGQFVCSPDHKPTIQDNIVKYWAGLAGFEFEGMIDVGWVTVCKRPNAIDPIRAAFPHD